MATRRRLLIVAWIYFAVALLCGVDLPAQTAWTGTTSTDWNTASNWNTGVPDGTADVVIDTHAGNMAVLSSGNITIGSNTLWVGYLNTVPGPSPAASLTIQSGAQLTSGQGVIAWGYPGDTPGSVTVTGAGSKWTNTSINMGYYQGNFVPDANGVGSISVLNGGSVVTSSSTSIGSVGIATALVDGTGSSWVLGALNLGLSSGPSSLTVSNGGYISTIGDSHIADSYNGNGTVTLTGAGSRWDTHGNVTVGGGGSGTLVISAGATLNMIGSGNGSIGSSGSGSVVPSMVTVTGTGSTWNPFVLTIGSGSSGTGTLMISNGGSVTTTVGSLENGLTAAGAAAIIIGPGSTWINNGYDYNFDIGTSGNGSMTLGSGGRFITKGMTLGSGAELHFQLGGTSATTDYGSITFSAGATSVAVLAGLLDVSLVNSFNPVTGATFQLFNYGGATVSGTFGTINLPTLGAGETWDVSNLYTTGTLAVVTSAIPEPSTYAALCGLIALGFGASRRRTGKRAQRRCG